MNYARMVIEKEAPEEYGYDRIRYNLSESSIADQKLSDIGIALLDLTLFYGEHRGDRALRELIAAQDRGLSPDDVLVTAGAAGALPISSTCSASRSSGGGIQKSRYPIPLGHRSFSLRTRSYVRTLRVVVRPSRYHISYYLSQSTFGC